ncbi:hypothetical protein ACFWBI_09055 [Streptomyces sp. NPDC059982]|uniref:hypothetical protein n=1 Tax=Streptomyces sp. NPDC059982 TaxID=3347024 RepID=UPI00367C9DAA
MRANSTRIAVLEHDLLGVTPVGPAAASIALRQAGNCFEHQPVAEIDDSPTSHARCAACGHHLTLDAGGTWARQ